ncbi:MAG: hypothetical protein R2873_19095 [Caldilineaceae bacterium]
MAEAAKEAILTRKTALLDASTGTGKSIAYLLPAILSGRTVVVATANKSLQNQLYTKDVPFLARALGRKINAVLVKGRSNYLCTYKWSAKDRNSNRSRSTTVKTNSTPFCVRGSTKPKAATSTICPSCSAATCAAVVSFPDDCLQRDCRHFVHNCFVNKMRDAPPMHRC